MSDAEKEILALVRAWVDAERGEDQSIAAGDRVLANAIWEHRIKPTQERILQLAGYEDVYARTHRGRKKA